MLEAYKGWTVKLEVNNFRDTIKSSNVIGYITGSVEPDRLVVQFLYDKYLLKVILPNILYKSIHTKHSLDIDT